MPLAPALRAAAALAVVALAAGACTASEPTNVPEVTGAFGDRPEITIPDLPAPEQGRTTVLREGTGPEVREGQVAVTDVEMKVWEGKRKLVSSWGLLQPTTVSFGGERVFRGWGQALLGRKGGSRVLMVAPSKSGVGPHGRARAGVGPGDHMVLVFDLVGGYGVDQRVPERKAPGVGTGSAPSVSFTGPKGTPTVGRWGTGTPDKLDVRVLVEGKGPVLGDGDVAVAQYGTWIWGRDKPLRRTYAATGPSGMLLSKDALPPGLYEALKGTRVGSRLRVAVPAQYRKGFTATKGGIAAPSEHPIFWVIDVLDHQDR
ncbi:FKBP-type peptidyl-prolyl cis-trans isomerase [Streptomyces kunmingensis]|uniref:Peptidyl-prolyl cis-trans isomerase n=1 Tax=Streptomyces kunmingensis TaxID=68225 RepID=A0ABU6CHI1_9ACTN|nr:FKBP-type peptidyl-prolyl cis-trans isomerase [Streptomyces kunmingensis]MEB3964180.1 FKBP-type peptidyl-prolyl cis-trans isomerase [Streptomyces kunmingensis]